MICLRKPDKYLNWNVSPASLHRVAFSIAPIAGMADKNRLNETSGVNGVS